MAGMVPRKHRLRAAAELNEGIEGTKESLLGSMLHKKRVDLY